MIAHILSNLPLPLQWGLALLIFGGGLAVFALRRTPLRIAGAVAALCGIGALAASWVLSPALLVPAPYPLRIVSPAPGSAVGSHFILTVCGVPASGGLVAATDSQHYLAIIIDGVQAPTVDVSQVPQDLAAGTAFHRGRARQPQPSGIQPARDREGDHHRGGGRRCLRPGLVLTEEAAAAHILVVEDDRALREVVVGALGSAGYETSIATHGITASQMLRNADGIDIVLLDIGLPFVDGWQILHEMEDRRGPAVIVISARGEETDKVRALDLGADDYLAKPFGAEELLARVRAVLRRVRSPRGAPGIVVRGAVRVDLGARTVTRGGVEVRLSPTEWQLLAELARNARGDARPPHSAAARVGAAVRGRTELSADLRAAPSRQARGRSRASRGRGHRRSPGLPVRAAALMSC